MSLENARRLGRKDGDRAIEVAREVPLSGTHDPLDLPSYRLRPAHPYLAAPPNTPELPARRIVTDWDEITKDWPQRHDWGPLTRFGNGPEVVEAGDDCFEAYFDALRDTVESGDAQIFDAVFEITPQYEGGEYIYVYSTYVTDLRRYEPVGPWPMRRPIASEHTWAAEEYVQYVFRPRGLGWVSRQRWLRRRRRVARGRSKSQWWA